jgi:cell division transport system permease protein
MERVRLFVGEAVRSLFGNLSTTVAATMTVLIGMFLLGLFIALGTWVLSWTDHVKKELLVKVYFCTELDCDRPATERQINAVRSQLAAMPEVRKLVFVSPDEALARMRKQYPELTRNLTSNPLPPAYEVTPKRAEDVRTIAERLEPPPAGVEEVDYAEKQTDRILRVAGIVELVFLIASLILIAASIILIANTIRLSIFARRREIEVMKLVGASNWFVRGPFMLEGLICGFLGSLVAVFMLLLGRELALPALNIDTIDNAASDVRAWSFELVALILVGAGLVLGALGSGITLRRFLRV